MHLASHLDSSRVHSCNWCPLSWKIDKWFLAPYLVRYVAKHIQSPSALIMEGMSLLQKAKAEYKKMAKWLRWSYLQISESVGKAIAQTWCLISTQAHRWRILNHIAVDLMWDLNTRISERVKNPPVAVDVSRAFDTVDHVTLLQKLEFSCIRGSAL